MSPPVADAAARTQAWRVFDRNLNVAAGAGTGKTRVLVDRYLAWVLGEGWRRAGADATPGKVIGSILAITFTEKAAGEMEERIGRSLRVLLGRSPDGVSKIEAEHVRSLGAQLTDHFELPSGLLEERARAVLRHGHRLEVSTIHAFAMSVLRAFPLEAGVHPAFQVDPSGAQRGRLIRRHFVDATRALLVGPRGPELARLLGEVDERTIFDLLTVLIDTGFDGALAPPPDLTRVAQRCVDMARVLRSSAPRVRGRSLGKLERIAAAVEDLHGRIEADPDAIAADPATHLDIAALRQLGRDLADFPSQTVAAAMGPVSVAFGEWGAAVRRFAREAIKADPRRIGLALELYEPMVSAVRTALQAQGLLSFDDLLSRAEGLLTRSTVAAKALAARYQQILVDEFQDTNAGQCELLRRICAAEPDRARLFVVGDAKQSIYGFRGADLAAYEAFASELELNLTLQCSFRAQGRLTDALNEAFDRLFVYTPGLQPPPQPLRPTRAAVPGAAAVAIWDLSAPGRMAEEARRIEAATIQRALLARDAERAQGSEPAPAEGGRDPLHPPVPGPCPGLEGPRWSRYAVLSRVQSEASTIVEALESAGIPCVVSGDKEFYRRQEVLDASNLLRVLLDPADSVAWIGVLRSPLGGAPDRVLVDIADAGGFAGALTEEALATAERTATPERATHIRRIGQLVRTLKGLRGGLLDGPIDLWLESLLDQLPLLDLYAATWLGERKAANLSRVLRGFVEAATDGAVPLREWLEEVATRLVGRQEESESALADETTDAVRVMSIHASKGLQFDHVFVPRLDWRRRSGAGHTDGAEATSTDGGWVLRLGVRHTWGMGRAEEVAERAEAAEALRLLYVACTRARESLTLCGMLGPDQKGELAVAVQAGFRPLVDGDRITWTAAEAVHPDQRAPERATIDVPPHQLIRAVASSALSARRAGRRSPIRHEPPEAVANNSASADLGTAVHAALERWDGGVTPPPGLSPLVSAIVEPFLRSPLADRVRRADEVHRELPWIGPAGAGTIDLLLRRGHEWTIIDYKTTRVSDAADAAREAQAHRAQGRRYATALMEALGTDQVRFEVWFVRSSTAVELAL